MLPPQNRKFLRFLLACILGIFGASSVLAQDWQELQDRLLDRYLGQASATDVQLALQTITPDGSFGDLNYSQSALGAYREHISRVIDLIAAAYANGQGSPDPDLYDASVSALTWWLEEDYIASNWWNTYIGFPSDLAKVTPVIGSDLESSDPTVYEMLIAYHRRVHDFLLDSPMGGGANLSDMGYYSLIGAVVSEDREWLDSLVENAFQEAIRVVGKDEEFEGWQVDASMHAHGPQLHNATYGSELMNSASRTVSLFRGTDLDLGEEALELLVWQLLEGVRPMIVGNWFDYNASGRGVSRPSAYRRARNYLDAIDIVIAMEPEQVNELQALRHEISVDTTGGVFTDIGIRNFFRSDFVTRKTPQHYTSVRMISNRTNRNETGNEEGRANRYFGDGIHFTLIHGDEYDQIPAIWNFERLPGLTARQSGNVRPNNIWGERGRATFAGSLSDGATGLAAMRKDFDTLQGWKSWFILDEGVLALGSDFQINPRFPGDINTTVNQTRKVGDIHYLNASGQQITESAEVDAQINGESWVWHRDVGYYFPDGNDTIYLSAETRQGDWSDIGTSHGTHTDDVFELYINHGEFPSGGAYIYWTFPGVTAEDMATRVESLPVTVLQQDEIAHAVHHARTGAVYAAFFEAGTISVDEYHSISVDKPALVMLAQDGGQWVLSVVDPNQSEQELTVELAGWQWFEGDNGNLLESVSMTLPGGDYSGDAARRGFAIPGYPSYEFDQVIELVSGWSLVPGLGSYKHIWEAWVYHKDLGFLFVQPQADGAAANFLFHPDTQTWFWHSPANEGWLYNMNNHSWQLP
ncbi:MAG: hypothetical protein JJU20_03755 [Opitutales bacterium]|nr:hypothetical protein [Opitutales bacterium]